MNNKFKELADKANAYTDVSGRWVNSAGMQKFAELIVRECAWAADFADKEPGDYILKRFGVE